MLIGFLGSCKKNHTYSLTKMEGDDQQGPVSQALPLKIKVQVLDESGEPQPDINVYFNVTEGNGSVAATEILSDDTGFASTNWTLGNSGKQALSVSVENGDGVAVSQAFTATLIFKDPRDNEVYRLVTIGSQVWFAENLRYTTFGPGEYVNPDNPSTKYGFLYNWAAMMNGAVSSSSSPSGVRGICPTGWHLPSDTEWNSLELSLGMAVSDTAVSGFNIFRGTHSTAMKSVDYWNGTNTSGFDAMPAGFYGPSADSLYQLGGGAGFWTTTETSASNARTRWLSTASSGVLRSNVAKDYGYSCRCLRD
jgi:uncharacterized protein (TIGR02145 family)